MQRSCVCIWLVVATTVARGDDLLHDGEAVAIGARTDRTLVAQLKADLAIFPYPGGSSLWGGPINSTRVDLTLTTSRHGTALEAARAEFIRWPHLHLLGIERDTRSGEAIGGELVGLYVPVPLWGDIGAREWSIFTIGADLGYRHQLTHAGARHAGDLGATTAAMQLAIQHQLTDRMQLRSFADVTYTLGVGTLEGAPGTSAEQLVELSGGLGIYYDITRDPPVRRVPRTDPATALVTYTSVVNEGKRWRWVVAELDGSFRPFDSISTARAVAMINTGIRHEY